MTTRSHLTAAGLWASAFVIAALVIVQAGRLAPNAAYADVTSNHNNYSVLTTDAGTGGDENPDELLYIIDSRAEVLLVYEIENAQQQRVHLRARENLQNLFNRAR